MKIKHVAAFSGLCLSLVAGVANSAAVCPGTGASLSRTALATLLVGNTVCVSNGSGGWLAQEQHLGTGLSGVLQDYKRGPGHATDPTTTIPALGSWTISGPAVGQAVPSSVTYNYAGGSSFNYRVWVRGANHDFCPVGAGTATEATMKSGTAGGCP